MLSRRRRLSLAAASGATLVVFAAATALVAGQTQGETDKDLVLGTWILNVEKSTYGPGPGPRSQRRTYEAHQDGVKATITTVNADGNSITAEYVADYDSLEYPITGSTSVDAISLKRVNDYTAEATLRHAHKIIGTARRVISEDRKTMTITYTGSDPRGEAVDIRAVYDREETR